MAHRKKDEHSGVETTGHEWDGISELDNPLPRWWLYVWYATIIWSIAYWVVMPAWPLLNSYTKGVLGHSDRQEVVKSVDALAASRAPMFEKLLATPAANVAQDPELMAFAQEAGRATFANNCATCHGAGGQGAVGYPSLADDVWLWDGTLAGIETTLQHGIRAEDDNTRFSAMPAFGRDGILTAAQVSDTAEFVYALSNKDANMAMARRGAPIFAQHCVSCHGADAKGMPAQGAPNLVDAEWLYGGTRAQIAQQIQLGRGGVMPNWGDKLDPATIRAVSIYVHSLGGGQ